MKTANKVIDEILGDVLDTVEEADSAPTFITNPNDGKPQVNIEKFDKLLEAFDINEGNMSANIQNTKNEVMKELQELQELQENTSNTSNITPVSSELTEITTSIVNTDELIKDHILVREALREDIASTRIVVSKLAEEIATSDMDQLNGQVTEAFASIKKSNVLSMKLLIDSYTMIAETQNKIKKLASELKTIDNNENNTTIENNIFVGSPSDLLDHLKKD